MSDPRGGLLAILLPVTSRQLEERARQTLLGRLSASLPPPASCVLAIGVDAGDPVYDAPGWDWSTVFPNYLCLVERFHPEPVSAVPIWPMACALAERALGYSEPSGRQCDLFVLLGDDVTIAAAPGHSWVDAVRQQFDATAQRLELAGIKVPWGFGVVALRDESFPGFPTFPVVGRSHMDIFRGVLVPPAFVNQDGDPYLWELYRRFGASCFAPSVRLSNAIGGDEIRPARYDRVPTANWKDMELPAGVRTIGDWLAGYKDNSRSKVDAASFLIVNVLIPSVRCPTERLQRIVTLPLAPKCDTQFIIIVDDPSAIGHAVRTEMEQTYLERVRVRVNECNMGASFSRNRALEESCAEWVIFLDDDVEPHSSLIQEYASVIRSHGDRAAGFVGLSLLPPAQNVLTKAVNMSYLTFFWGVARLQEGGEQAPWGVTANVCSRCCRARFDLRFPKTGGGEDIDYLRRVVVETELPLLKAPDAVITHPWWNDGVVSPLRFYGWARGDAKLCDADKFPQHIYHSWPNMWELCYFIGLMSIASTAYSPPGTSQILALQVCRLTACLCAVGLSELALDAYALFVTDANVEGESRGLLRLLCAIISTVYKNATELGHIQSALERNHYLPFSLCSRFDWWMGIHNPLKIETKQREFKRFLVMTAAVGLAHASPHAWVGLHAVFSVCAFTVVATFAATTPRQFVITK